MKTKDELETLREAIMRLNMCACRECEICKYKSDTKDKLPNEECKARSMKNTSILADAFLRVAYGGDEK